MEQLRERLQQHAAAHKIRVDTNTSALNKLGRFLDKTINTIMWGQDAATSAAPSTGTSPGGGGGGLGPITNMHHRVDSWSAFRAPAGPEGSLPAAAFPSAQPFATASGGSGPLQQSFHQRVPSGMTNDGASSVGWGGTGWVTPPLSDSVPSAAHSRNPSADATGLGAAFGGMEVHAVQPGWQGSHAGSQPSSSGPPTPARVHMNMAAAALTSADYDAVSGVPAGAASASAAAAAGAAASAGAGSASGSKPVPNVPAGGSGWLSKVGTGIGALLGAPKAKQAKLGLENEVSDTADAS